MDTYLWIALGSALGGAARFGCTELVAAYTGPDFPWGTILVNVIGSFIIGAVATLTAPDGRWLISPNAQRFVIVGILGGYTTFSAFSWQTLDLLRAGEPGRALANVALSLVLCLVAVWLGHTLAASLNRGA
jgi:fluoride exporter